MSIIQGTSDSDDLKDRNLTNLANPILTCHSKFLLLDIVGCTTSLGSGKAMLSFIHQHIDLFVERMEVDDIEALFCDVEGIVNYIKDEKIKADFTEALSNPNHQQAIVLCVKILVESHKTELLRLMTYIRNVWDCAFKSGMLKGHIYQDVLPFLEWCQAQKVSVSIYSGGSVHFQKLLFSHSLEGDLTSFFEFYFDFVNAGPKEEPSSYINIATSMGVDPKDITFVSDSEAELVAAREAGIGHVVMCVRPGNAPLTSVGRDFPIIHSLLQLCGV